MFCFKQIAQVMYYLFIYCFCVVSIVLTISFFRDLFSLRCVFLDYFGASTCLMLTVCVTRLIFS